MTYVPIPRGTEPWDEQVNAAFTDQDSRIDVNAAAITSLNGQVATNTAAILTKTDFTPSDYGLAAWSYDPIAPSGQLVVPAGTVNMIKVKVTQPATITTMGLGVSVVGAAYTAGQNFIGLYDSNGTRLGQSTDQSTNWATSGWRRATLTAPVPVTPGFYYLSFLANFTSTAPQFIRGSNLTATPTGELVNLTLGPAVARVSTFGSGLTALPASINMATRTISNTSWWLTASS